MVTTMNDRQRTLDAETRMFSAYFGAAAEDRRPGQYALLAAIVIHAVLLYITLPRLHTNAPRVNSSKVARLTIWRPPPPPPKEPPRPVREHPLKTQKVPLPDPTPEELEPITEPEPDPEPLPADLTEIIGTPPPPPIAEPEGPFLPGVAGVSTPERILYVEAAYPEVARKAGIQGVVTIQAIITKNGEVASAAVISCTVPNVGFEAAAMDAVRQWRYDPGKQNGKPVDVYFTVTVNFTMH